MIYSVYGVHVASEIEFPLATRPEPSGGPDVDIRLGPVDWDPPDGEWWEGDTWLERGWSGGTALLVFPGLSAALDVAAPVITVDVDDGVDPAYVAHVVLDHVLPRWLYLRGDLVLHGGAVVAPSGQAVAFVGTTGRGKSSLVTALATAGWPLLGDDACRLGRTDATWWAHPSYPGVRLNRASRAALAPGATSSPMAGDSDKHRVLPDVRAAVGPVPLGLVVELGADLAPASLQRLSLGQAVGVVTQHSFSLSGSGPSMTRDAFARSGDLATDVPVHHLEFPRRWDVFADVAALVDAALSAGG